MKDVGLPYPKRILMGMGNSDKCWFELRKNAICDFQIQSSLAWRLLPQLSAKPPDAEALRVYAILPWCPVFSKPESLETLHYPFAQRMNALEGIPWKIIGT